MDSSSTQPNFARPIISDAPFDIFFEKHMMPLILQALKHHDINWHSIAYSHTSVLPDTAKDPTTITISVRLQVEEGSWKEAQGEMETFLAEKRWERICVDFVREREWNFGVFD